MTAERISAGVMSISGLRRTPSKQRAQIEGMDHRVCLIDSESGGPGSVLTDRGRSTGGRGGAIPRSSPAEAAPELENARCSCIRHCRLRHRRTSCWQNRCADSTVLNPALIPIRSDFGHQSDVKRVSSRRRVSIPSTLQKQAAGFFTPAAAWSALRLDRYRHSTVPIRFPGCGREAM